MSCKEFGVAQDGRCGERGEREFLQCDSKQKLLMQIILVICECAFFYFCNCNLVVLIYAFASANVGLVLSIQYFCGWVMHDCDL